MILEEENAGRTFDEVGLGSLEMLIPGFTEDSQKQATLSAGQSGTGCKRSVYVARLAHLGAVVAGAPWMREMIRDASNAGLLVAQTLFARLDMLVDNATAAFLENVDGTEWAQQASTCRRQPGPQMKHGNKRPVGRRSNDHRRGAC